MRRTLSLPAPPPVLLLFGATMFLSALLLFWIQLVIAKMLLPRLGGTPAVWNTCMLFFQVMLLAGYSYVLVTTTWIGARTQAVLQIALLLLSALYLPFALAGDLGSEPSSLLFGVTTYITTEIAPTPLLWTIPLALYLVTFILAFARKQFAYERLASYALGGLALLLALVIATSATEPTAAIVLLHLAFFSLPRCFVITSWRVTDQWLDTCRTSTCA